MAERIIIRLPEDTNGHVTWGLVDDQGNRIGWPQTGEPETLLPQLAHRRVQVLVPGERILLTEVDVPTRNSQRMAQAVPYLLEERLAADVETQHFALGPRGTGDRVAVAVVDRDDTARWRDWLREHDIVAEQMTPDVLAVPMPEDGWSVALEGNRAMVRTGVVAGFVLETTAARAVLESMLEATAPEQRPEQITVLFTDDTRDTARSLLGMLAGLDVPARDTEASPSVFARMLTALPGQVPINLLQGEFRPRRETSGWWRPWRIPAALAAAWLVLALINQVASIVTLHREETRLDARVTQLFQQAMPGRPVPADPRNVMLSHLKLLEGGASASSGGFLALLATTGAAVSNIADSRVNALSYREGVLDASLLVSDAQTLDQLKQTLTAKGLRVEIQSANSQGKNVEGRLEIR
ncbi:MAG: type II secretion system protein GspL, partial [Gammaproteobacteria bacterium]